MTSQNILERFKAVFSELSHTNTEGPLLDSLYRQDLVFEDAFHRIEGLQNFKAYCSNLYSNLSACDFMFGDEFFGNDSNAMLTWTMHYSHPKLNRGKTITVDGASLLFFEDQLIYHQKDYFDGGALLYEHIPLLGNVLSVLKRRLA